MEQLEEALNKIGVKGENKKVYLSLFNKQIALTLSKYTESIKDRIIETASKLLIETRKPTDGLIKWAELTYTRRFSGPSIDLSSMSMDNTKKELQKAAENAGIDVGGMTKEEILKTFETL